MAHGIQLLECTIRDGALGLEDAFLNNISDVKYTASERKQIGEIIANINSDIVEIGSIEITAEDKKCFNIYQSIEEASCAIPNNRTNDQIYVAMFRGPDTPLNDIPVRKDGMLDGVRVIIRYSELKKSLEFCAHLTTKGYKVFIQPMATMRYADNEIQMLIDYANDMNAYALYFVDSYGYMMPDDVIHFTRIYDRWLKDEIKIGFHAHNNINMAFANALTFLDYETERDIIVDATASGMGQGAGNLQTEIIASYLNSHFHKNYNYAAVLDACDFVEKYNKDKVWGYSVTRAIPAINHCAYKYAIAFRNKYGLSYSEMHKLFENMPSEYRHRFTDESAKEILRRNGFGDKILND